MEDEKMLSKKLLDKQKTISICLNSKEINTGDVFRGVKVTTDDPFALPQNTQVVCCGTVSSEEMLFRTEDGQYYFSLVDGWGAENAILYGLNIGLFYDFKHPTQVSSIAEECKNAIGTYNTWGGAMAYYSRKRTLQTISNVLQRCPF